MSVCLMNFVKLVTRAGYKLLALFLLSLACLFVIESFLQTKFERMQRDFIHTQLDTAKNALENRIHGLIKLNLELTKIVQTHPQLNEASFSKTAELLFSEQSPIISMTVSNQYQIRFIYPLKRNESVLGLDYRTRPEVMAAVNRAIQLRDTVISGPLRLIQNGRLGFIIRTPVFDKSHQFLGLVSIVVNLEQLLEEVGLTRPEAPFEIAMRGREGLGEKGDTFFGKPDLVKHPDFAANIRFPNGQWYLMALFKPEALHGIAEIWIVRIVIGSLFLIWSWIVLKHEKQIPVQSRYPFRLSYFFVGTLFFILLPILMISGWHVYQTVSRYTEQYTTDFTTEVSSHLYTKVADFFETPRRVLAYTTERANAHLLPLHDPSLLARELLLHVRQQSLITFVSVGTKTGDYLAATRPPINEDKGLRFLSVKAKNAFQVEMHRIDDANRFGSQIPLENQRFDPRTRPWYKAALAQHSMVWYGPYHYGVRDIELSYNTMGLGVAAPLFDQKGDFFGVCAVDIALSQLSTLLTENMRHTGGIAFVKDASGRLFATSSGTIYQDHTKRTLILAEKSENAVIRETAKYIQKAGRGESSGFAEINNKKYALDWRTYFLPQGPILTLVVVLPETYFVQPVETVFQNIIAILLAVTVLNFFIFFFVVDWLTRPLVLMKNYITHLMQKKWENLAESTPETIGNPITEMAHLSTALIQVGATMQKMDHELDTLQHQQQNAFTDLINQSKQEQLDAFMLLSQPLHFFEGVLAQEWEQAKATQQPLGLLMLSLDYFTEYKQYYGNKIGEMCLQAVAQLLRRVMLEKLQFVTQLQDETFICIFPQINQNLLQTHAEQIQHALFALAVPHHESPFEQLTVSIGIAHLFPTETMEPETLLAHAKSALKRAQHAGGNRVFL